MTTNGKRHRTFAHTLLQQILWGNPSHAASLTLCSTSQSTKQMSPPPRMRHYHQPQGPGVVVPQIGLAWLGSDCRLGGDCCCEQLLLVFVCCFSSLSGRLWAASLQVSPLVVLAIVVAMAS